MTDLSAPAEVAYVHPKTMDDFRLAVRRVDVGTYRHANQNLDAANVHNLLKNQVVLESPGNALQDHRRHDQRFNTFEVAGPCTSPGRGREGPAVGGRPRPPPVTFKPRADTQLQSASPSISVCSTIIVIYI